MSRDKQMLSLKQGPGGRSGALLPASPARAPEVIPREGQVFEALRSCFMGRVSPPTPQLRREL